MPTFCNISVVSQRYKIVASILMFAANVFSLFINTPPTFTSQVLSCPKEFVSLDIEN